MPDPWLTGLVVAAAGYLFAVPAAERRGGAWPWWRTASWCAGLALVAVAVTGPVAAAAHHDFAGHMAAHLLLGMAAPLLLVAAAPIRLALRALPVHRARSLSRLLRSSPVRVLTHPATAVVLNAGGLWLLYTTQLYPAMHRYPWVAPLVHLHMLAAGYLFTAAMIGTDPMPHRPGRPVRAVALVAGLAAHGILAKYLYGHPPAGVPAVQAESGAQLMYYVCDLLQIVLIVVFCRQWYAASAAATEPHPVRG